MFNSKQKIITIAVLGIQWFGFCSAQMLLVVFLEKLNGDNFINVTLIAVTEILATLFSKVLLSYFGRRKIILVANSFTGFAFIFLVIFPDNQ